MTLLTAVNWAQRRLSLPVTAAVVADGQETQNLLYALATEEAQDLLHRHDWPQLRRTQTFTASFASLQSAPGKPANFQRMVKGTFWNRTTDEEVCGPMNDREWGVAYGEPFTSAIRQYWMLRNDGLHIFPVPTAADTLAFDYIINTPVLAADGTTYKTEFTADTDTFVLEERLLRLGIRWRYLADKGRDYAEALKDYELAVADFIEAGRSSRDLSIAPDDGDWLGGPLIPDTGYGA